MGIYFMKVYSKEVELRANFDPKFDTILGKTLMSENEYLEHAQSVVERQNKDLIEFLDSVQPIGH
jgi:hypothetical protein